MKCKERELTEELQNKDQNYEMNLYKKTEALKEAQNANNKLL